MCNAYVGEVQAETKTEKLKIAVAKFTPKAPKYKSIDPEGEAFSDMLITALYETGHFILLEREILEYLEEEAKEKNEFLAADVMITGAITAFEPEYKKRTINISSIFGGLGCLFSLFTGKKSKTLETLSKTGGKIETKQSYVAIDLRVVEVRTREILGATRVSTVTSDIEWEVDLTVFSEKIGALATAFKQYRNTPMEKAIYETLLKAVKYIVSILPSQ